MEAQSCSWPILLIMLTAVTSCYSDSGARIHIPPFTATEGSCAEIGCRVIRDLPDRDALLFWMKDGIWDGTNFTGTVVYSNSVSEKPISSEYIERATYTGSQRLVFNTRQSSSCDLKICDLKVQDTGSYVFRYISKSERWSTNKASLTVEAKCPITFDTPGAVRETFPITLTCSTKHSCPYLVIESVPQSGFKTINSKGWRNAVSMTFRPTWQDDNREFSCQTEGNTDPHLVKKIRISVQYGPSVEVESAPPAPHSLGDTVTLTCAVVRSSPPPDRYTWYKDGQEINQGQKYVKNLQPEDSGSYKCSASNSVSTSESTPLQIDVQYEPRDTNIVTASGSSSAAVGDSVTFRCVTKANPAATYHWYWYKKPNNRWSNPNNQPRSNTAENSLDLRSVQRSDEACYSCRAQNIYGPGDRSADLCLQVQYPPTNPTLTMPSEVREGESLSITCTVDSSPESTLTLSWTHSSQELKKSRNPLSYSLSSVNWTQSGEYICLAANDLGSTSTNRSLSVLHAPQNVHVEADPGLEVKENMTLTLHCRALSNPPLTSVTWTVPGPQLHTGPILTVHSVTVRDSGLYTCTAANTIGKVTSAPAQVQVHFGPKQVEVQKGAPDVRGSVTLSCSSHSVPAGEYTWYRTADGQDLKVSETIDLTVESTQPGVYYCTAANSIGQRRSEAVSLFQDGGYKKFMVLALVPVVIIIVLLLVFRLKRKKSAEEGSVNPPLWRNCSRALGGGRRDRTEDHRPPQGEDIRSSPSSNNCLYSTVNLPKDTQARAVISDHDRRESSLNYASLHFEKRQKRTPEKAEQDVVYSTVKNPNQEMADVYENISTVHKSRCAVVSESDSSEDEVDVRYAQVNYRTKAPRRSAEEDYSELKF